MAECPQCSTTLPNTRATFCPRCGSALPAIGPALIDVPAAKPIRLEKRGTLLTPFFMVSVAMVVGGALVAGEGQLVVGLTLLAVGVPTLLIATLRSLVR